MATYKAQDFCAQQETTWCPQIMDAETTAIASRSSYMTIDYQACDRPCLLAAMNEVSRRGAIYGMQWAEQMFTGKTTGIDDGELEKLHWTMWYLSYPASSVTAGALKTHTSNGPLPLKPFGPYRNSSVEASNAIANYTASAGLASSHGATNLLTPYVDGSACNDAYLCEENNRKAISEVLRSASSAINGTTWLAFMLADEPGAETQGLKRTFPSWTNGPPCTGCPPPPGIGAQRPPPNWTPGDIPQPPANPNAPEAPVEPRPPREPLPEFDDEQSLELYDEDDYNEERDWRKERDRIAEENCGTGDRDCIEREKTRLDEIRQKKLKKEKEARRKGIEEDQENADQRSKDEHCKGNKECDEEWERKKEEGRKAQEDTDKEQQRRIDEAARKKEEERKGDEERRQQQEEEVAKACQIEEAHRREQCELEKKRKQLEDDQAEEQRRIDEDRRMRDEEELKRHKDDEQRIEQEQKEQEKRREEERKVDEESKQQLQKELDEKYKEDEAAKLQAEREALEEERKQRRLQDEWKKQQDDQRKAQEEQEPKSDKKPEKEEQRKIGEDEQDDKPKPDEVEEANQRAREDLDRQRKQQAEDAERQQAIRKPCLKKPCPEGPLPDPPRRPDREIEAGARYRSTHYDLGTGNMRAGDLVFHPIAKSSRFSWEPSDVPDVKYQQIEELVHNGYEPYKVMQNRKWSGKVEWRRPSELMQMDDPSWLHAGDHSFKMVDGDFARNALGDIIPGAPRGSPPRTAEPVPRKKVNFDDRTSFILLDSEEDQIKGIGEDDLFTVPNPCHHVGHDCDRVDWSQVLEDRHEIQKMYNSGEVESLYHPGTRYKPPPQNEVNGLPPDRTDPWEGSSRHRDDPGPSSSKTRPGRLDDKKWPPPGYDGSNDWDFLSEDEIMKLKQGKLGKLPKASKFPKIKSMGGITKVARFAQQASSSLLPSGPMGGRHADVWWHCLQERTNIFGVHTCGMVGENGNEIKGEDKGPFLNFVNNFYGWMLPEDIDGDGKMEDPFTKFVAGMQDLGGAVYDFFDSSEDGTGFKENTETFFVNGVETIVNVELKFFEWIEDKTKDAYHSGKAWWNKEWGKTREWLHHLVGDD